MKRIPYPPAVARKNHAFQRKQKEGQRARKSFPKRRPSHPGMLAWCRHGSGSYLMRRAFFCCTAMVVLWPLAGPVAAEPAVSKPMGISVQPAGQGKLAYSREGQLRELLDGLTRQIDEIDANIANLGPNNAAALRFRAVSLAAYQRAWAELTRGQVDFGDAELSKVVAALAGARP